MIFFADSIKCSKCYEKTLPCFEKQDQESLMKIIKQKIPLNAII